MKQFNLRLTEDQIKILSTKVNASHYIRTLINKDNKPRKTKTNEQRTRP